MIQPIASPLVLAFFPRTFRPIFFDSSPLRRHISGRTLAAALGKLLTLVCLIVAGGCASLPTDVARPVSHALANPADTSLARAMAALAKTAGTRNDSAFAMVSSAELAFTSRMALIKAAQKTLDLQYYAIHADETTERLFDALRQAADRGVRVRILLDDFNTSGKNAAVLKLAFEKNTEMRLFNPLPGGRRSLLLRIAGNLPDIDRFQRRMHNKILVADNTVAITGGRNLGETYFGQSEGTNFVDIDILAAGRIARDLSRSFDQYWNNPQAYPVQALMTAGEIDEIKAPPPTQSAAEADMPVNQAEHDQAASTLFPENRPALVESNATRQARTVAKPDGSVTVLPALPESTDLQNLKWVWAPSTMLVDKPEKIAADADSVEELQDTTVDGLLQLMAQAKSDLLIVSPYFVPGDRMMTQIAAIRERGVRIRVLTNSLASNDAPAAHVGYARYREALLGLGVELYEMRAEQPGSLGTLGSLGGSMGGLTGGSMGSASGGSRASLHAKVVVADDRLLVVGSMNLDLRSRLQNSEIAIVIRNRTLAAEATRLIAPALTRAAYRVQLQDGGGLVWQAPSGSGLPDSLTEPDASFGLRLLVKAIGPFAPEEML
jgi:cardiolipin synthase C